MALQGNLRDFSITQLLNLINLACKTGMLVIEGPVEVAQITFRDGKLSLLRSVRKRITSRQYYSSQRRSPPNNQHP